MDERPTNVIDFPSEAQEDGEPEAGDALRLRDKALESSRVAYLAQRRAGEGVERAIGRIVPLAPDLPLSELAQGWERSMVAERSAPALASRAVDLRSRLEDVLEQVAVARSVLEQAQAVVEGPPPWGWAPRDGLWPSGGAVASWRSARNDWLRLTHEASELGERLTRMGVEGQRGAEYARTLEALRSEYSGGGPQYDLLVEALASIDTRIRQMDYGDRDVPPEEYQKLSELRLKYITQLQKHTESLKSESVQPVQDAISKLMQELEREIKPSNPTAWEEIVKTTVRAVQKHGLGMEQIA